MNKWKQLIFGAFVASGMAVTVCAQSGIPSATLPAAPVLSPQPENSPASQPIDVRPLLGPIALGLSNRNVQAFSAKVSLEQPESLLLGNLRYDGNGGVSFQPAGLKAPSALYLDSNAVVEFNSGTIYRIFPDIKSFEVEQETNKYFVERSEKAHEITVTNTNGNGQIVNIKFTKNDKSPQEITSAGIKIGFNIPSADNDSIYRRYPLDDFVNLSARPEPAIYQPTLQHAQRILNDLNRGQ